MWENEEIWYFPELTREQAKTILQGEEMGVFLVRVSSTADRPGPVLSVSHFINGTQRIIHFAIEHTSDGKYAHGTLTFPSLHAFLLHYRLNPLTDDGSLRLTSPAAVRYFAKNDWTGSDEMAKKVFLSTQHSNDSPASLMPVQCGQILRLLKRKPLNSPISVDDCADAKLWLMETDHGVQGLVPSTCLLVYVRSEYESFMQRQRQLETVTRTNSENAAAMNPMQLPPPLASLSVSRPVALTSPFSDRRLGYPSQLEGLQQTQSFLTTKLLAADKFEMPPQFPAKAVAVLDRNPNFYDRTQLRFRKGDILTVTKPVTANTLGVEDTLAYGWSEACIEESGRKGLIPLFSAYIKWL